MDIERSPPVQRGNEFCLRFVLQSPKEESLVVVEWSERIYSLGFYLSDKLRNDQVFREMPRREGGLIQ